MTEEPMSFQEWQADRGDNPSDTYDAYLESFALMLSDDEYSTDEA